MTLRIMCVAVLEMCKRRTLQIDLKHCCTVCTKCTFVIVSQYRAHVEVELERHVPNVMMLRVSKSGGRRQR